MAISFVLLALSLTLTLIPSSSTPATLALTHSHTLFLTGGVASSLGSTRWTISRWSSLKNKEVGVQKGQKVTSRFQAGGGDAW